MYFSFPETPASHSTESYYNTAIFSNSEKELYFCSFYLFLLDTSKSEQNAPTLDSFPLLNLNHTPITTLLPCTSLQITWVFFSSCFLACYGIFFLNSNKIIHMFHLIQLLNSLINKSKNPMVWSQFP